MKTNYFDINNPPRALWNGSPFVWLVGYAGESSGGFEWGTDRKELHRQQCEWRDAGHDVSPVWTIYLDSVGLLPGNMTREQITAFFDARPDLWEPAAQTAQS